jgi:hypothetical protein
MWLCFLKLLYRRFSLIYMSDSKADDGKRYKAKEWLKRTIVRQFDGALIAGEKHRAYAHSLGIPHARSRVGFDVIDVEYFSQRSKAARNSASDVRAKFGMPPQYCVCVSRFVPRKNVDVVIEAYFQSGLYKIGQSLVLIGQGRCRDPLASASRAARLGRSRGHPGFIQEPRHASRVRARRIRCARQQVRSMGLMHQ